MGKRKQEDDSVQELKILDYIPLREKYKCDKCSLNTYNCSSEKKIKKLFATCKGEPCKMTQCKKRCWFFSDLFIISTAIIIAIAFICIFSYFQDFFLSLAWTMIFAVALDFFCCMLEYFVDKIFGYIEIVRRNIYDKKVANIEAIHQEEIREAERKKQQEAEVYKDINIAKELYSSLSNEYLDKLTDVTNKSNLSKKCKKIILDLYNELLKNIQSLLDYINLENFYFSEVKIFFQIHLPKLIECVILYIESIEDEKETPDQIKEFIKLLDSFNKKVILIQENLASSEAENILYKMQALRMVVSNKHYEEDE